MKQLRTMEGRTGRWGLALGLVFLLPAMGSAQTVVSSSGGSGSGGGHTLSWTIGEPVVKTVSAGNVTLTQGFQQPWADISTVVEETDAPDLDIRVYPNPADRVLNVDMPGITGKHELMLHDAAGRIVLQAPATAEHTQLDLEDYGTGNYILRVLDADAQTQRTFKIIINH